MEKKDIYEHLARIYLDSTTPAAKKKSNQRTKSLKNYFFYAAIPLVAGVTIFLLLVSFRPTLKPVSQTSLVISQEPIKFSFNLDPSAKKQVYDIDLKRLNLAGYTTIVFSLKDTNNKDSLAFRVEFSNAYNERSEMYIRNIDDKWKEYKVSLADFKGITDWTEMAKLSFAIEEWNTKDNKGILYIDNVKFVK